MIQSEKQQKVANEFSAEIIRHDFIDNFVDRFVVPNVKEGGVPWTKPPKKLSGNAFSMGDALIFRGRTFRTRSAQFNKSIAMQFNSHPRSLFLMPEISFMKFT